jgi:hypothetical protein
MGDGDDAAFAAGAVPRLDRNPARATGLTMSSVFPGADRERMGEGRAPLPEGISMFSQVERVVGEEYALLAMPTYGLGV